MLRGSCAVLFSVVLIGLGSASADSADYSCTNCFDRVSSGEVHSCAIREDASLTCWGGDGDGQSTPPSLSDNYDFAQVSAGGYHTCAVVNCYPGPGVSCPSGNARCWGLNGDGQASPGINDQFSQVSAGFNHTCGLKPDGSIACWGDDDLGQSSPPSPPLNSVFIQVSAGGFHTCAVSECTGPPCPSTNVSCWGFNAQGPTMGGGQFNQVSAGGTHTCGVKPDGSVECWGSDVDGQSTPPSGSFVQVSAGFYHTCGLKPDGSIACWGDDDFGQATPPVRSFQQVSAGGYHTCGLKPDGSVTCWGHGANNQLLPTAGLCGLFHGDFEEGGDCRWSNGSLPCWSADCDGDGYASREAVGYCNSSSPIGVPAECPTGSWIDQPAMCGAFDCLDDDADVYSGQVSYFSTGYGTAGALTSNRFDYNCDGVEQKRYRNMNTGQLCCASNSPFQGCRVVPGPGCNSAGWDPATVSKVPDCGETANYVICAPDLFPSNCIQKTVQRTQSCQ